MEVYTITETLQQAAALPLGALIWIRALALINLISLIFIKRKQARWVLAALLFIMSINIPMLLWSTGLVKILGLPHVIAWAPLIVYLAHQLRTGQVELKSKFGVWILGVITLNLISIVFDTRDVIQYLFMGQTSPMVVDSKAGIPLGMMVVVWVWVYSLNIGPFKRKSQRAV